jgi:amino acid transporter
MAFEEKNAWSFLIVSVVGYAIYLIIVLSSANGRPLIEVDYVPALLWTVGGAIVANIVASIVVAASKPKEADKRDQRDREIKQYGDRIGQSFVIIGAVAALVLAMFEAGYFWIANAVYLCFVLSAVLGSVAKLTAYRGGFSKW